MRYTLILTLIITILASCSSGDGTRKKVIGKAQSAPYELLLVANKEWLNTQGGQAILDVVQAPIKGIPQTEPSFKVTKINPEALNGTFKTYGMIVTADVNRKYKEPRFEVANDVYCRPQLMIRVTAPDDEALAQYLTDYGEEMLNLLNEHEFARERELLSRRFSGTVQKKVKSLFNVAVNVPKEIDDIKTGKDFIWSSSSKQDFKLNFCIYTIPLRELTLDDFIAVRDSVMKINIPGGKEGQWMETDARTVTYSIGKTADGTYAITARGLWDIRDDAMGGPFVSYITADKPNNRLIITEGFVFAPKDKKRPLIREMEAALQTLSTQN